MKTNTKASKQAIREKQKKEGYFDGRFVQRKERDRRKEAQKKKCRQPIKPPIL